MRPAIRATPCRCWRSSAASNVNTDGTVRVTDPLDTARTYGFSRIHDAARMASQPQPCDACAATYDANGNPDLRAEFNGHQTGYDFDLARNLEIQRIEATTTTEERTISTQWHTGFWLPELITEPGRTTAFAHDPTTGNLLTRTDADTDTATAESRTWSYDYTSAADGTLAGLLGSKNGPHEAVSDVLVLTSSGYYK